MTFRFLHLADLHLDTHFGGRQRTKARLRTATGEAFSMAVEYALERELHAVLVAGDLFDDPLLSLHTELQLARHVRRLTEAGVWFLYVCGNHDPGGKRAAKLGLPSERVHVFDGSKPIPVVVTDADGDPVGVVVGAGHPVDHEERNLAAGFTRLDTDLPVVGLLHTSVESARSAENHDRFAPSTGEDYERLDYVYWALGHVHLRQRAVPGLPVWYAGNLQGRNPRETGAKGGLFVSAEPGGHAEPEFVSFAPVRWEVTTEDDLGDIDTVSALADALEMRIGALAASVDEELAVRLELRGDSPLAALLRDPDELRDLERELLERTGVLEVQVRARGLRRPRDLVELGETPSVLAKALELAREVHDDETALLRAAPQTLAGLPSNATSDERRDYLRGLVQGIEYDLVERCLEEEEE